MENIYGQVGDTKWMLFITSVMKDRKKIGMEGCGGERREKPAPQAPRVRGHQWLESRGRDEPATNVKY